jgi:5-methyltetrahydrofolate--homocysteine methyltransferase
MPANFMELIRQRIVIGDGAMGTILMEKGLEPGACPEEWNLTHQDVIKDIYSSYFEVGCDFVETNTFGGNNIKLGIFKLEEKAYEINFNGARLAREVAPEGKFVAASVGPTGQLMKPYGEKTYEEVYEGFLQQITALVDGGADIIFIETMSDPEEIIAAIKAAKTVKTDIPVIASMIFEPGKRGFRTMMGTNIETAVKKLTDAGADIIGSNCGGGIEGFIQIIKEMRTFTDKYLVACPNAGIPRIIEGKTYYPETPDFMASKVGELIAAGVNIVGGCCGTTPVHMAQIRAKVLSLI